MRRLKPAIDMDKLRKCVGCGKISPREEMIKITKEFDTNKVIVNPNSLTFGRSAYLCYNHSCIEHALKKNRLAKVLKADLGEDLKGIINEQFKS